MNIDTFAIASISAAVGTISALATGFAAWGNLRSDVRHHSEEIETLKAELVSKADKVEVREGFRRIEVAMQALTERIDRFLDGRRP